MKLKVVIVDLELSSRAKRALGACMAACVLTATAIAYAGNPLTVWSQNQTLNASALNGNFTQVEADIAQRLELGGTGSAAGLTGGAVNLQSTQMLWQAGSSVVNTNAGAYGVVNFTSPFPNGVLTVVIVNGDANTNGTQAVQASTLSNFTFAANNLEGVAQTNTALRCNWVAIGW